NPMLEVADVPALIAAAKQRGILVAVDNTFATPLLQTPLDLGADIVVHSVTKYLAGHSDVVLGAALTSSGELRQRMHTERSMRAEERRVGKECRCGEGPYWNNTSTKGASRCSRRRDE